MRACVRQTDKKSSHCHDLKTGQSKTKKSRIGLHQKTSSLFDYNVRTLRVEPSFRLALVIPAFGFVLLFMPTGDCGV